MTLLYRLLIVLAIAIPAFLGTWLYLHQQAKVSVAASPAVSTMYSQRSAAVHRVTDVRGALRERGVRRERSDLSPDSLTVFGPHENPA